MRPARRHIAALLAAGALLAAAPAARAADPIAYPAARGSTALAFAGPRLLWLEGEGPLHGQDPGGRARVLSGSMSLTARCPGGSADRCTGTAAITGQIGRRRRALASQRIDLSGGQTAKLTLTADRKLLRRVGSRSDRRRRVHRVRLEIRMSAGRVDERVQSVTFRS